MVPTSAVARVEEMTWSLKCEIQLVSYLHRVNNSSSEYLKHNFGNAMFIVIFSNIQKLGKS